MRPARNRKPLFELPNTNEFAAESETVSPPPPTRSSFMATWPSVTRREGILAGRVHQQLV